MRLLSANEPSKLSFALSYKAGIAGRASRRFDFEVPGPDLLLKCKKARAEQAFNLKLAT